MVIVCTDREFVKPYRLPDGTYSYDHPKAVRKMGFYMDGYLKANLDNYIIPAVKANWDGVLLGTGIEGCQPAGSKVFMADGTWKKIEDVMIGDVVISPQDDETILFSKVVRLFTHFSEKNYQIATLNRKQRQLYECSSNHMIPLNRVRTKGHSKRTRYWVKQEITAEELSLRVTSFSTNSTTPLCPQIQSFLNRNNCIIEPYTLGVYLGDGTFNNQLCISNSKPEIIEYIRKYYDVMKTYIRPSNGALTHKFSILGKLAEHLSFCGLRNKRCRDKFIPKEALYSDCEYRKKLLSGLIDTDGYLDDSETYEIVTKSPQLAEDIIFLVHSLGFRSTCNLMTKGIKSYGFSAEYYRIHFYTGDMRLPQLVKYKTRDSSSFYLSPNRLSITSKEIPGSIVYGFTLDSPSHLYVTDNYAVTKNSGKTVNNSSICAYLDQKFNLDRVVFTVDQLMEQIDTSPKGSAILFDESIMGMYSQDSGTSLQTRLIKKFVTIRKKNLFILLLAPSPWLFRLYFIFRTRCQIHTYSPDGVKRGYFKFYGYDTKRRLYIRGKNEFDMSVVRPDFIGRFTDTIGCFYDINAYDAKKEETIRSLSKADESRDKVSISTERMKSERNVALLAAYKFAQSWYDLEHPGVASKKPMNDSRFSKLVLERLQWKISPAKVHSAREAATGFLEEYWKQVAAGVKIDEAFGDLSSMPQSEKDRIKEEMKEETETG